AAPQITVSAGKARVRCSTEGASIAWTTDQRWRLYAGEFSVAPGSVVRAMACRLGYRDSVVVETRV
ncbi:MAG: hypothetical protein ACREU7_02105, partial [Burkholderiales bacterium]